jgi:hypothetical protein
MTEDGGPQPHTLARIGFYADSPVGGAWGHELTQTAPGTATSESWDTNWAESRGYRGFHDYYGYDYYESESESDGEDDDDEGDEGEHQNGSHLSRTIPLPSSAEEQAKLIASWIITMNVEFWVALEADPLATDGLTQDQQEQWEEFWSSLPWNASVTIDADLKDLIRGALAELSEEYADTRAALADPTGPRGQALLASAARIIESFFD